MARFRTLRWIVILLSAFASVSGQRGSCLLPLDMGQCADPYTRYFYDKSAQACRPFSYGGLGGNLNRFSSVAECMDRCHAAG
ncbi:kappaPI-actitoxin-Avd3b-like [Amblyomma americanum]